MLLKMLLELLGIGAVAAWFLGRELVDALLRRIERKAPHGTPSAIKPHRCIDADAITRAGDGVLRCKDCYIKERRRATFCGEDWPLPNESVVVMVRRRADARPQPAPLLYYNGDTLMVRPAPTAQPGRGRSVMR